MNRIPLIIRGAGKVGRALVRATPRRRGVPRGTLRPGLPVAAWVRSDGVAVDEKFLATDCAVGGCGREDRWRAFATPQAAPARTIRAAIVDVAGVDGCIVVDVTAPPRPCRRMALALRRGSARLSPTNRLAGLEAAFDGLTGSRRFRYESTVGSAVPAIAAALGLVRGRPG